MKVHLSLLMILIKLQFDKAGFAKYLVSTYTAVKRDNARNHLKPLRRAVKFTDKASHNSKRNLAFGGNETGELAGRWKNQ